MSSGRATGERWAWRMSLARPASGRPRWRAASPRVRSSSGQGVRGTAGSPRVAKGRRGEPSTPPNKSHALVVLVTAPSAEKAAELGRVLVSERLAACASVVPGIRSIYWWEGRVQDEPEALIVLKTTRARLGSLRDRVLALHPYQVPEVVALGIEGGNEKYLEWIAGETG